MTYILQYYQAIKDGSIIAGKWVQLFYAWIVDGLEAGEFFFDEKKASRAIRFIEGFCRHYEGKKAPQLIVLELWQKALVACLFGVVDETGARQFRECCLVVARKNGKTLLAAAISAFMFFLDGEYGARIYFAAPKLEQASLCYNAFCHMIETDPELSELAEPKRFSISVPSSNSTAKALSFNSKTSDGFNIFGAVTDEIAAWKGEQGLKFYNVLRSSFGARTQPLLLSISSAGYERDGIYDDLIKRGTAILLGNSKEKRFAPIFYMIDDPQKWADINELRKANPNLGVSIPVNYLLDEITIAENSLAKKAEFFTKYANVPQNSSTAFLPYLTVEAACQRPVTLEDFPRHYAVAGIDLSKSTDLSSCCIVVERDGVLHVVSHFWMPKARLEEATAADGVPYRAYIERGWLSLSGENHIDYRDCFNWLRDAVKKYKCYPLRVGYDRYSAQYLIDDLREAGFFCDDVYQGYNLTSVIRNFDGDIRDGKINIGDNQLLKMHLLNSAVQTDTQSEKLKLVKIAPRMRIDGMAALLDALTVRQKWYGEIGKQLQNKRG